MPFLPPLRKVRRHLPLVVGALVLTQVPALPLLILLGHVPAGFLALYVLASLSAAFGLVAIGIAYWERIERIVSLVRSYAEEGRLPSSRKGDRETNSIGQVRSSLASLDRVVRTLEQEAARDPLTGILNRRTCSARLEGDLARSRRSGVPFSVAIFDLDDLKSINDDFGHAAGDAALRHLSQTLQSVTREGDWVARWGGDEFLIGLWSADKDAGALAAARVLESLATNKATLGDESVALGASVGVAQADAEDDSMRLFSRADNALLQAKRAGRGRVCAS